MDLRRQGRIAHAGHADRRHRHRPTLRLRAHRACGRAECAFDFRTAGHAAHRRAVRHPWPVRAAGAPAARPPGHRRPLGTGQDTLVVAGDVFRPRPAGHRSLLAAAYGLQQQALPPAVRCTSCSATTRPWCCTTTCATSTRSTCAAPAAGPQLPAAVRQDSVIGQWLRTRPVLLKIGDTLFLHGGISPEAVAGAGPGAHQRGLPGLAGAPRPK